MRSDWEYGPYKYEIVKKWNTEITAMFNNESLRITELFAHLYFYIKRWNNSTGNYYPDLVQCDAGLTLNQIIADFNSLYRKRLVAFPHYFYSDEGNEESADELKAKLTMVLDLNYYKYKKLIEQMGLVYDPLLTNVEHETGTDTKEYKGTKENDHEITLNKISSVSMEGPLMMDSNTDPHTTANLNTESDAQSMNLVFDAAPTVTNMSEAYGDTRQGAKVKNDSNGTGYDTDSDKVRQSSWSGPYDGTNAPDSHEDAILDTTVLSEGSVGQSGFGKTTQDLRIYGKATIGNPNAYNYTDTEKYTNRKDIRTPDLTKEGFNGDYSDTIEKQRNLIRFSVLKEFFDDLSKEILLAMWG